ncbi:MAG: hypothetical protein WBP93_11925 [Pyrinomonadaceae bacterium]
MKKQEELKDNQSARQLRHGLSAAMRSTLADARRDGQEAGSAGILPAKRAQARSSEFRFHSILKLSHLAVRAFVAHSRQDACAPSF